MDSVELMTVKTEKINNSIEIVDSDDERDVARSNVMQTVKSRKNSASAASATNTSIPQTNTHNQSTALTASKWEPQIEIGRVHAALNAFDSNQEDISFESENDSIASTSLNSQRSQARRHSTNSLKLNGNTDKRLKCKQCGYVTNRSNRLKRHQQTHARERSMGVTRDSNGFYECIFCTRKFSQMGNLCLHMNAHKKQ